MKGKGKFSVAAIALLVYLSYSFINWEMNPQKWDEFSRFLFILLSTGISIIYLGKNSKNK